MADIVILNGRIITFAGADAQAIAITDEFIEAEGSTRQIQDIAGSAQVIDAGGATVLPGFIDSHVHLFGGSAELNYLNLTGVTGIPDPGSAVKRYAESQPNEQIFLACGDRLSYCRRSLPVDVMPSIKGAVAGTPLPPPMANTDASRSAGILHPRQGMG